MAFCWETRGCDSEMMARCPHCLANDLCPAGCWMAACTRKTHVVATDITVLLNPDRDYDAAIKETCHFCEHFLKNGPCLTDLSDEERAVRAGRAARFLI